MCARQIYYIFANAADGERFCAVRQDQPIPSFLDGKSWHIARTIDIQTQAFSGFDADDADEATRRCGLYHFRRELIFAAGWRELAAA